MSNAVKHIAFVKFKADRTPEQIAEVWRIIEELPKQIPGILSLSWGPNISPEGLDQGYTHSFIMTFENAAARDAYLPHPVHQAAVKRVVPQLESVIVCDHEAHAPRCALATGQPLTTRVKAVSRCACHRTPKNSRAACVKVRPPTVSRNFVTV